MGLGQTKQKNCVSGYPTVLKFWLLSLKFLEQQKYSFNVSERVSVLKPLLYCLGTFVSSLQIHSANSVINNQPKKNVKAIRPNRTETKMANAMYTMLWGSSCITNFSFAKCDLLPEGKQIIISIPGKFPMQMIFEEHPTVPWREVCPELLKAHSPTGLSGKVHVDSSVTISDLSKQFDLKSLKFSSIEF